ncbi:hypothetical protein FQA39_LY07863 [Lamprigera yunnana]|nr:hypothetical protein FQA39_LY07863 [Lamprigera yunnana]
MNLIRNLNTLFYQVRFLYIAVKQCGQERVMKKIMTGVTPKKKFKYYDTPVASTPSTFSKGAFEGKMSSNSKRANVLNKLFTRYITDLMACSEYSSAFVGHGIEINKVQITPDYSCIRIYWIANGKTADDVVENILESNTANLRHELAQLKVVGVIPQLKFFKDKEYARMVEVDRLLSQADFGNDYHPLNFTRTHLEIKSNLQPQSIATDNLPDMSNDIFGLNHFIIMERIKKSKKKSQALHRLKPTLENQMTEINKNPIIFATIQDEREAFKQFLLKQQVQKHKAKKELKNYKPELTFLEEEWIEKNSYRVQNNCDIDELEDKDFIDDNNDRKI